MFSWFKKVSHFYKSAFDHLLMLRDYLIELSNDNKIKTLHQKDQIEVNKLISSALKSKDVNSIWVFLEKIKNYYPGLEIPQYLLKSRDMFTWERDLRQSTRQENKSIKHSPSSLKFSATGFPESGIEPKYSIFIPRLQLGNYASINEEDFNKLELYLKSFCKITDDGVYIIGSPQAWRRFLEISHIWYPAANIMLDRLPVEDVTSKESKRSLSSDSYASMSIILKKYALGHSVSFATIPFQKSKKIKAVGIKDGDGLNQKLVGVQIYFPKSDPVFSGSGSGRGSGLVEYLQQNFDVYRIFKDYSVFIPLTDNTFEKLIQLSNFLNKNYGTSELGNILEEYDKQRYEKSRVKTKRETMTSGVENPEELARNISKRRNQNQLEASRDVAAHFLRREYQNITDNPQFFSDVESEIKNRYVYAFDPNYNQFLRTLQNDVANNLINAQVEGVAYGVTRDSFILADQPGSGKTNMGAVIADINAKIADAKTGIKNQILVISPRQLIDQNWVKDSAITKFIDPKTDLNQQLQVFTADNYDEPIDPNKRWIVTHYHMFMESGAKGSDTRSSRTQKINNFINKIRSSNICCVIMDESQVLKNPESTIAKNVSKAVKRISKKIAMSGTPSDNTPSDLYGQLSIIDHPVLYRSNKEKGIGYIKQDRNSFCMEFFGGYGSSERYDVNNFKMNVVDKPETSRNFLELVEGSFLRRERQDINQNLPPSEEKVNYEIIDKNGNDLVTDNNFWVNQSNLAIESLARSKAMKSKDTSNEKIEIFKKEIINDLANGKQQTITNVEQALLQQTAIYKAFTTASMAAEHIKHKNHLGLPNKVLILTNFVAAAQKISEHINSIAGSNVSSFITGAIDASSRNGIADEFKDPNSNLKAMVFTIETGYVGYNFEVANKCIFNDFSWNPSKNEQGTDRIRRLTSKLQSEIIFNVLPGSEENNIDSRMFTIMQAKSEINTTIHDSLKNARLIKEDISLSPQDREQKLNELSTTLTTSIYQSLLKDQEVRLLYQSIIKQQNLFTTSQFKPVTSWLKRI